MRRQSDRDSHWKSGACLAAVLLLSAGLVGLFHNRFWWPPDEGNYAYVAERLLSGDVLHRDIQDVHAGYINFVNAAAFSLFGMRLVSLRYPIAVLTVVQSGLMFLLLGRRGLLPASIGAIALASLSFVQFLNPTANWYCLFIAIATIGWLRWVPGGSVRRDVGSGFLVASTFLFRQPSGLLLGMGVMVFVLLEWPHTPSGKGDKGRGLARATLLVIGAGLALYLAKTTDGGGWFLFGVWPFPILLHAWRRTAAPNKELSRTLCTFSLGAAIAVAPLIIYHLAHGSLGVWVADVFGAAVSLPSLPFLQRPGYLQIAVLAFRGLALGGLAERLNAVFWLGLLIVAALLGLALLRMLARRPPGSPLHPLPIVALFYAVVSVHYQIPIYLFYTAGLSLAALLWCNMEGTNARRAPVLWFSAVLAVVALYYQAAMPASRGLQGVVAGERRASATPLRLARAGLYVESEDAARYHRIIDLIAQQTEPGDTILALPSDAELYFLADRRNPFRFYNTALGVRSPGQLDAALLTLRCHPPKLVFYRPGDKYNTVASERMMHLIQNSYEALPPLPPFEVFRRTRTGNDGHNAPCATMGLE
jgi:hypothetical protein